MVNPFKVGDWVRFRSDSLSQSYMKLQRAPSEFVVVGLFQNEGGPGVRWLSDGSGKGTYSSRVEFCEGPW